jgi:nitrous oxide reductase
MRKMGILIRMERKYQGNERHSEFDEACTSYATLAVRNQASQFRGHKRREGRRGGSKKAIVGSPQCQGQPRHREKDLILVLLQI